MQDPGGAIALQEASFHFVSKPKVCEVLDIFHRAWGLFCFISPREALETPRCRGWWHTIDRGAGHHSEEEERHHFPLSAHNMPFDQ